MKFLETITTLDNSVLVPINRIKYIFMTSQGCKDGSKIVIKGDDGVWEEYFCDDDKLYARYKNIMAFLNDDSVK